MFTNNEGSTMAKMDDLGREQQSQGTLENAETTGAETNALWDTADLSESISDDDPSSMGDDGFVQVAQTAGDTANDAGDIPGGSQAQSGPQDLSQAVPREAFDTFLAQVSSGVDPDVALEGLKQQVLSVVDPSDPNGSAAADAYVDGFKDAFLGSGLPMEDAIGYANSAYQQSVQSSVGGDNSTPGDSLLAAIASGENVEDAVDRLVGEMAENDGVTDPDVIDQMADSYLGELQDALADGAAPGDAIDAANTVAQETRNTAEQSAVEGDGGLMGALASGENVDEAIDETLQDQGDVDPNAFMASLEENLNDGANSGDAFDAARSSGEAAQSAADDAEVPL